MATTSKATAPKRERAAKTPATTSEASASQSQVTELEKKIAKLEAQVTNLTVALEGQDTDGDGIPDISGLTARVDNIIGFMRRKWGEGPIEQAGLK